MESVTPLCSACALDRTGGRGIEVQRKRERKKERERRGVGVSLSIGGWGVCKS